MCITVTVFLLFLKIFKYFLSACQRHNNQIQYRKSVFMDKTAKENKRQKQYRTFENIKKIQI